jgi:hypothetical protein
MAKGSKTRKGEGAKRKAPARKRERGAKAPRDARSIGAAALQLAQDHPIIGDIVVAGLLAAAAALAEDKKVKGVLDAMVGNAGGEAAQGGGGSDKGAVKTALKAAAGAIGKSLLDEIWKGKTAKPGKA